MSKHIATFSMLIAAVIVVITYVMLSNSVKVIGSMQDILLGFIAVFIGIYCIIGATILPVLVVKDNAPIVRVLGRNGTRALCFAIGVVILVVLVLKLI